MRPVTGVVALCILLGSSAAMAEPLAARQLGNGCVVTVDWPEKAALGTPQIATVTITAPAGKALGRVVALVGYNEAAGSYVPSQVATAVGTAPGGAARTLVPLTSPSWALWPVVVFADGQPPVQAGGLWPAVLAGDVQTMLPAHGRAVPFERPDEYDWVSLGFIAGAGSPGLQTLQFQVPLVITKSDASLYVWAAAAGPGLAPSGEYIPASLAVRAGGTVARPSASAQSSSAPAGSSSAAVTSGPVTVTSPQNGQRVGPSVEVVGRATPGALIVIWTEVYKQRTGELVEKVPGIRHKTQPDGSFHFRVATPRIFMGPDTPLVYKLKVKQITAAGETSPVEITLYPAR